MNKTATTKRFLAHRAFDWPGYSGLLGEVGGMKVLIGQLYYEEAISADARLRLTGQLNEINAAINKSELV